MKPLFTLTTATAILALATAACNARDSAPGSAAAYDAQSAATAPPLKLATTTEFPGYTGDFDHFAIDTKDGRLFLAGEEYHEVEVLDLPGGKILRRLKGYGAPHSLL